MQANSFYFTYSMMDPMRQLRWVTTLFWLPRRIILTASGGAFRDWPVEKLKDVTVAQAITHPNWSMGKKITIDR